MLYLYSDCFLYSLAIWMQLYTLHTDTPGGSKISLKDVRASLSLSITSKTQVLIKNKKKKQRLPLWTADYRKRRGRRDGEMKGHRKWCLGLPQTNLRKGSKGLPRGCVHQALRWWQGGSRTGGTAQSTEAAVMLRSSRRWKAGQEPMWTAHGNRRVIFGKLCFGKLTSV